MIKKRTDVSIVIAQLASFSELLLLSQFRAVITVPHLIVILGAGLTLLIGSGLNLGHRSYSPLTTPKKSNVFVRQGIYRYIRHPIYLGLLITGLPFLLSSLTLQSGLAFGLLILVTNIRVDVEEGLLEEIYPGYKDYREQTKRYIPFVY